MEYNSPITEIIPKRRSWRKYKTSSIEDSKIEELEDFIEKLDINPFSGICRFEILKLEDISRVNQYASYGIIKGASYYIVGIVPRSEYDLEYFSYFLEAIILKATELDLGTCWLGGTVRRDKLKNDINLERDERIPAISPLGYPDDPGLIRSILRSSLKAKSRNPWEEIFFEEKETNFSPLDKYLLGDYATCLEMVRLGPSAKNGQPWRIIKEEQKNNFHFYRANSHQYARLDIGIAVCHFDLTRKEKELEGKWEIKESKKIKQIVPDEWLYTISWIGEE